MDAPARDRTTKHTLAVMTAMRRFHHATNAELHASLKQEFPNLSATTVHRITARLLARGGLRAAPTSLSQEMRYDGNVAAHDHFMCTQCGVLKDAMLRELVVPHIESAIGDGCEISGNITISGVCKRCHKEEVQ